MVHELEQQRERMVRGRRRQVLLVGVLMSLLVHICAMIYFGNVYRWRPVNAAPQLVSLEFAIEQDDELTEMDPVAVDELLDHADAPTDLLESVNEPSVVFSADAPVAELEIAAAGSVPTLGGSGESSTPQALSGGGAGTSFFGISSKGRRFAYIVDRSASMGQMNKMVVAKEELLRSVQSLPDYAYFFVLLFSNEDEVQAPPMQRGWMQARGSVLRRFERWLRDVGANGGTYPRRAFRQVFSLDVRPDVVFFLTDGEIPDFSAAEIVEMNSRGRRVVINTIAFGERSSQELLKQIAADSGGLYRYVPTRGN